MNGLRKLLFVCALQFGLTGCATNAMVFHSFGFDTRHDNPPGVPPNVQVLDFQYGSSGKLGTQADKERVRLGMAFPQWGISGVMPRGEFLYVKWRISEFGKSDSPVYEDKVDLNSRLPADIANHTIYFAIKGPQLYVYLISPELKVASEPEGPIGVYRAYKQYQIYP